MPFAENRRARVYWDAEEDGAHVLLIMGLGCTADGIASARFWQNAIERSYSTIGGVGRSDVPPGPYAIELMASDAAAVLDAAVVASAHVFGFRWAA
jgi:pimeloyl-ACP methyl ester carboxylesterase